MRAGPVIAIAIFGLVASAAAAAAAISSKDKQFVTKAVQAGKAEVAAGQLATSKSSSDDVKKFAQHMVDDHTKAGAELEQIAQSKGLTVPSDTDSAHKKLAKRLDAAQGADFDRLYAKEAGVKDHSGAVKLFEDEAKNGKDPDLKAFAAKTLPTIKDHYEMAKNLAGSLKKS